MRLWLFSAVLLASAVAVAAPAHTAALEGSLQVRIEAVDASAFPQVQATVTVLDAAGRPIAGLPPEAFQASAGAQPVPISGVAGATDQGIPIAVVLGFDVSGSMAGDPLAQAKEAGELLVDQLGPADQVAVVAFADDVSLVQPLTGDRDALAAAIDGLSLGGNTALYDGVARSAELAAAAGLPRRAVVLLSDGTDFGGASTLDSEASLAAARASGVPFFVVGLGGFIDQPYLQELAAASRGQFTRAPSAEDLADLYRTIGDILRHQYVLTLDGAALPRGQTVGLRVTVSHDGALATAELPLAVPAPPAIIAPVVAPPEPVPAALPEAAPPAEGASGVPLPVGLLMAAAGLVLIATGLWLLRRRGRRRREEYEEFHPARGEPPLPPLAAAAPSPAPDAAWLQLVAPVRGEVHRLSEAPVTIGFSADCGLRLPNGAGERPERARVWRREGRYMLHALSRPGDVTIAGRAVVWVVLEDGDELEVGPCRLVFRLGGGQGPPADEF